MMGVFVQLNTEPGQHGKSNPIGYVIQENGCWEWVGNIHSEGYGMWSNHRRARLAHRVMYERTNGPIPSGLTLDHLCRNRACVNPGHLEAVTSGINTLRGHTITARCATATHCKHGHEFDEKNTRYTKKGRDCKMCNAIRCRRDRARALLARLDGGAQ